MIINVDYRRTVIINNIILFFFFFFCDFLPVGHTHEDIDAFFGVLAQFIRLRDAYDIDGKSILIIKYNQGWDLYISFAKYEIL